MNLSEEVIVLPITQSPQQMQVQQMQQQQQMQPQAGYQHFIQPVQQQHNYQLFQQVPQIQLIQPATVLDSSANFKEWVNASKGVTLQFFNALNQATLFRIQRDLTLLVKLYGQAKFVELIQQCQQPLIGTEENKVHQLLERYNLVIMAYAEVLKIKTKMKPISKTHNIWEAWNITMFNAEMVVAQIQ